MDKTELINTAKTRLLWVTDRPEIVMVRGSGTYLTDSEGKKYLDFIGGWAVNCLGHSPEAICNALRDQSRTLINASPAFYNRPMLEYAEMLVRNSCLDRVFFASTGAEANEGAIKLARKYGAKHKNGASDIITTHRSFHGRTLTTMSATGKAKWEPLFEPKTRGFVKTYFNDIDSVRAAVTERTCAIMVEPIQGEGGVNVATQDYMTALRELCSEQNILLIFDEIQTGMGRTGKLFCYEHYEIEPDILTLGKGIGGGFPLSALLAKEHLNIFEPGDQGGTYTAQPLAMSVGLAVLTELLDKNLIEHCAAMGNIILGRLRELSEHYEVENIRGMGLLIAFDLTCTKGSDFVSKALEDGLLVNSPQENSIRLMPPLIVTEDEIEQLMIILKTKLARKTSA